MKVEKVPFPHLSLTNQLDVQPHQNFLTEFPGFGHQSIYMQQP